MKKLLLIILIALVAITTSCKKEVTYPIYSLGTENSIPDSLKAEHREYVIELVRAASQHMSGGDYEDVDVTIRQANWTADGLFGEKIIILKKQIDDNYYNDMKLHPNNIKGREKAIYDSLMLNLHKE